VFDKHPGDQAAATAKADAADLYPGIGAETAGGRRLDNYKSSSSGSGFSYEPAPAEYLFLLGGLR
jgi:hypothetical protein